MTSSAFVLTPLFLQKKSLHGPKNLCPYRHVRVPKRAHRQLCMDSTTLVTIGTPDTAEDIVREIWRSCETAKFTSWLPFFDDAAVYYDTLYPQPFVGKSAIAEHLKNMESAIPPSIVFVLDDVAAGTDRVGARWHAETGDGVPVPFSRGASMYSFVQKNGKLFVSEAWDFVETPFKVAGVILPLLRGASAFLRWLEKLNKSSNGA